MTIHTGHNINIKIHEPTAVTIGKFDGLHRGHTALIKLLKNEAQKRNLACAILSFSPHPAAVLANQKEMPLLLTSQEKCDMLIQMGIDHFIEYPFTREFAELSPRQFVADILINKLETRLLVVGEDYRFGKGRQGDIAAAKEFGREFGMDVLATKHIEQNGDKISSNAIRSYIAKCDFAGAEQMLGYPYFVSYSSQGFDDNKLLPPIGKYMCKIYADEGIFSDIVEVMENKININVSYHRIEFCYLIDFLRNNVEPIL